MISVSAKIVIFAKVSVLHRSGITFFPLQKKGFTAFSIFCFSLLSRFHVLTCLEHLKNVWERFKHVWERFKHVWERFKHVWERFKHVWDRLKHVW